MRLVARERLTEAAADLGVPPVSVHHLTACGPTAGVPGQAAEQYDIDVIVLAWRRAARLRPVGRADRLGLSARRVQDSSPRGRRAR